MTATLYPNRATALAALWWLFEGATFNVFFADTSAATTQPEYNYTSLGASFASWEPYLLSDSFDQLLIGPSVAYDSANNQLARLPQLEIVLDYNTAITYTHMIIFLAPNLYVSSLSFTGVPLMLFVHESPAVTVASTETKTYTLDLTALFS